MAILLVAALATYNNALNLWPPFHTWVYVPVNLGAAAVAVAAAMAILDLEASSLGLRVSGAGWGLLPAAAAATAVAALLKSGRGRALLADQRLRGVGGVRGLFTVLVRIPLGTALVEEVCFRGVAFAAFAGHGSVVAGAVSAGAFGLWHVVPTVLLVRANRPGAGPGATAAVVAGGVAATAIAGLGLAWLRVVTGGIAAPAVAHAGINMAGALGAMAAHRARGVG